MNTEKLREYLRRDGWILAALILCAVVCIFLSSAGESADPENERISRVLSAMEGAGETQLAIVYDAQAAPCGAVVVAEGADSVAVRLRLTSAVSTLLGLDPSAVAVYPLDAEKGGKP